jgi:hypothetical protein
MNHDPKPTMDYLEIRSGLDGIRDLTMKQQFAKQFEAAWKQGHPMEIKPARGPVIGDGVEEAWHLRSGDVIR